MLPQQKQLLYKLYIQLIRCDMENNNQMTFEEAAEKVKTMNLDKLSNDVKLDLYALYKQATVGDINTSKPGIFDQKGRAKWDAWNGKKSMFQDVKLKNNILH